LEPSSRVLPQSVTCCSVSSVPFRAIPGRAPCVSDSAYDAARFTPHLTLQAMNSPAVVPAGLAEQLSDKGRSNFPAEHTPFNEYHVTHTSLLNNASCDSDLISPRMFGHARTSRNDLEYPGCMNSSESQRLQRVSADDILDSDEDGLHLVNPDKMSRRSSS
jgi:hypothetical protein